MKTLPLMNAASAGWLRAASATKPARHATTHAVATTVVKRCRMSFLRASLFTRVPIGKTGSHFSGTCAEQLDAASYSSLVPRPGEALIAGQRIASREMGNRSFENGSAPAAYGRGRSTSRSGVTPAPSIDCAVKPEAGNRNVQQEIARHREQGTRRHRSRSPAFRTGCQNRHACSRMP